MGAEADRATPTVRRILASAYKAAPALILVTRQRQLPTNQLWCGSQSANIRLINRRKTVSSVHPYAHSLPEVTISIGN